MDTVWFCFFLVASLSNQGGPNHISDENPWRNVWFSRKLKDGSTLKMTCETDSGFAGRQVREYFDDPKFG
jgi:hypothetical protein